MNLDVIFAVVLLFIFLGALIWIVADLRLKNRFGRHRIVQNFVKNLSDGMMEGISKSIATDNERFLVVSEWAKISDESIFCEYCSVFFSRERMCLLKTVREKRLMACAIAKQLKKRIATECSSVDEIKGRKYHIKTRVQSVSNGVQKCFLLHIYYIVPNEAYVQAERW